MLNSHPDDIDVFVGGVTETPRDGALVGPLFECLLGHQFRDLKQGDRYWYETIGVEGFKYSMYLHIKHKNHVVIKYSFEDDYILKR